MLDMLEDVNTGVRWCLRNIEEYGGDTRRIYLVGQSCGAQLLAQALLTQVPPCPSTVMAILLSSL